MSSLSSAIAHSLPEAILAAGAVGLMFFGALRGRDSDGPVTEIAAGLIALAIAFIFLSTKTNANRSKLSDEDVEFVKGKYADLLGLLQGRQGYVQHRGQFEKLTCYSQL